jgi:DNA ligase-1
MIDLMHGVDADLDDLEQYVGFWQQEKYRGVRMYWDGRAAWTRQGREIELPDDWYDTLPKIALDCELYDGPHGERRCASVTRFGPKHITPTMRIITFDAPDDGAEPWEHRIVRAMQAVEAADFDRIEWAPYSRVKSVVAMLDSLQQVHDRQGEGLMLRKPRSTYEPGYQQTLIKLKFST